MSGIYAGIRVVELAGDVAVRMGGRILCDRGADIVLVHDEQHESAADDWFDRDKTRLQLAVSEAPGQQALATMLANTDVLLTDWTSAELAAADLSWDRLRRQFPALIVVHNERMGGAGPWAQWRANPLVFQALGGLMGCEGKVLPDGAPAALTSTDMPGFSTGIVMALGAATALFDRARRASAGQQGGGQLVRTPELLCALTLQGGRTVDNPPADAVRNAARAELVRLRSMDAPFAELAQARAGAVAIAGNIFYRPFATADGALFIGALSRPLRDKVRAALDSDFMHRDGPDFDLSNPDYVAQCREVERATEAQFRAHSTEYWLTHLQGHGVPCGEVAFPEQLAASEQAMANRYIEFDPQLQRRRVGPGVRFSAFAPASETPSTAN